MRNNLEGPHYFFADGNRIQLDQKWSCKKRTGGCIEIDVVMWTCGPTVRWYYKRYVGQNVNVFSYGVILVVSQNALDDMVYIFLSWPVSR